MAATPIHRATLLIGYGDFGLDVLRRFLASTAVRGVLSWEETGGADRNARRLRDLSLLGVADRFGDGPKDGIREQEGGHSELLRDLYAQIHRIDGAVPGALAQAMEAQAKRLLDAADRAGRQEALPLGLDVIVLAQPRDRTALGRVNPLLQAGLERLERYATQLQRPISGASALNFIQILDFDNYWQRSEPGRVLREAVCRSVERWQQRREEGKPSFGRIYLVDGLTGDGVRDARQRIDEISLFLEFLLFEGQRGEMQSLYQPQAPHESPLATFGIRLLERSGGLLRRLAAAHFGMQWLDYLAGVQHGLAETQILRGQLQAYRAEALDNLLEAEALPPDAARQLQALEDEFAKLPVSEPDWPQQIEARHREAARRLESEWAAHTHEQIHQILSREPLADLSKALRASVDQSLHHDRRPATLGAVIRELEAALQTLDSEPAAEPEAATTGIAGLKQDHRDYQYFKQQQLDAGALHLWWPVYSLLLALGLNPPLVEEALSLPSPDPLAASPLWQRAYPALHWLAEHPSIVLMLSSLIFWALFASLIQHGIAGRVRRARRFWTDPERGRLAGRLRALLQADGELGRHLDNVLRHLRQDQMASLRSEVGRELGFVLKRLRERRRELAWLRGQLREFLILHGLNPDSPNEKWTRMDHERTGIRHTLERYPDFEQILHSVPPVDERFQSLQAQRLPFAHWDERYSDAFLYPLRFVDELSEQYRDPFEGEPARPGTSLGENPRAGELREFLTRHGGFTTAFSWRAQEGVPADRVYCLLPRAWLGLQGIPDTLSGLGIAEPRHLVGADAARAYLLRVRLGVGAGCLAG